MENLVWIGAVISVIGLIGLVYSVVIVTRAKRNAQSDDELRDKIRAAMPINLGAFLLSTLGLMAVIVGLLLS